MNAQAEDVHAASSTDTGRITRALGGAWSAWLWRIALLAACALSILIARSVGHPSGYLTGDPALARLLRAMALIKGLLALPLLTAVLWRLGGRVRAPYLATYVLGCAGLTGGTALIAELTLIVPAAVMFHVALAALLVAAWRDDGARMSLRSARRGPVG